MELSPRLRELLNQPPQPPAESVVLREQEGWYNVDQVRGTVFQRKGNRLIMNHNGADFEYIKNGRGRFELKEP